MGKYGDQGAVGPEQVVRSRSTKDPCNEGVILLVSVIIGDECHTYV